jgi:predicted GNAT family acetyltransferase
MERNAEDAQPRASKKTDYIISLFERFEPYSLSAYTRFKNANAERERIWILEKGKRGVLLQSGRTLYPVFVSPNLLSENEKLKKILKTILEETGLHAIQGKAGDVESLEELINGLDVSPYQRILYDMMVINKEPSESSLNAGPPGLILRPPRIEDADPLFELQADYEKEEVLTKKSVFVPEVCRLLVERAIRTGRVLLAEYRGRIVGKVNVNTASRRWIQISGVYVKPEFRNIGVASRMVAVFVQGVSPGFMGVSLFVKKTNEPAFAAYRRIGFTAIGDYRISYY